MTRKASKNSNTNLETIASYLPNNLVTASFLFAYVFYSFFINPVLLDNDVPWHIAAGDLIIKEMAVPAYNPYSFIAEDVRWYNISWLWDVFISAFAKAFGVESLYFLTAFLYAILAAVICHSLMQRSGFKERNKNGAIIATIFISVFCMWIFANIRPQIMTCLMVAFFSHILHQSRNKDGFKSLLILPLLTVLWVNTHGGFLAAFVIIGAYVLESYLEKDYVDVNRYIITGFLCFAAIFINPLGWEIITATLRTLNSVMTGFISEWTSFKFNTNQGFTLFVLAFILCVNPRSKSVPISDKVLSYLWFIAALVSIRNFAVLAVIAAPILAINLSKIGNPKSFPVIDSPVLRVRLVSFTILILIIFSFTNIVKYVSNKDLLVDEERMPIAAMEYVKENHPNKRFINSYDIGGWMIYFMPEDYKIFIDGRAGTAYSEEMLQDYLDIFFKKEDWLSILKKYNIDGFIMNNTYFFTEIYDREGFTSDVLERVFEGKHSSVFLVKKAK